MTTSEGWELYVSTELPIASTLDALSLLFEKELPPEKRAGLRYIDMRIENRVYYAFKDAPAESIQTSSAIEQAVTGKKPSASDKKKE
jgi:hypothetical protein